VDVDNQDVNWTVDVNWGDGSKDSFTVNTQGSLGSQAHTYASAGSYTVTVTITGNPANNTANNGPSLSSQFTVNVNPPVLTAPDDQTIDEGDSTTGINLGSLSDPDGTGGHGDRHRHPRQRPRCR
jgi:hypothetical protein